MGALVITPTATFAMVRDISSNITDMWGKQDTIINQAELHIVPVLLHSAPFLFHRKNVFWFIDNTSAESAVIKGASPTASMAKEALAAALMFTSYECRVWTERVPSKANPSDVLSRAGWDDPVVQSNIAKGLWQRLDAHEFPWHAWHSLSPQLLWLLIQQWHPDPSELLA